MAEHMVREPLSSIDILIAGGGLAGLIAAIGCYRRGHNVRVVEQRPGLELFGDLIGIQFVSCANGRGLLRSSLRTILD